MDATDPPYSVERFQYVQTRVTDLLVRELLFPPSALRFVPVSAFKGENLTSVTAGCALRNWYTGPTLVECIDTFRAPELPSDLPLRAVVTAVLTPDAGGKGSGASVSVRVLQGRLRCSRRVAVGAGTLGRVVARVTRVVSDEGGGGQPVHALGAGHSGIVTLVVTAGR